MKKLLAAAALGGLAFVAATAPALSHGCHRTCQKGNYGWHRHAGPSCVRVSCEHGWSAPKHRCYTKCNYFGPFKQCKTVCD